MTEERLLQQKVLQSTALKTTCSVFCLILHIPMSAMTID